MNQERAKRIRSQIGACRDHYRDCEDHHARRAIDYLADAVVELLEEAEQPQAPGVISDAEAFEFLIDAPPEMVPVMLDAIRARRKAAH